MEEPPPPLDDPPPPLEEPPPLEDPPLEDGDPSVLIDELPPPLEDGDPSVLIEELLGDAVSVLDEGMLPVSLELGLWLLLWLDDPLPGGC